MSRFHSSILLVVATSLALAIFSTTTGCSDDPDAWNQSDSGCNVWESDACPSDEICHDDRCQAIEFTTFEIEIIDGEMLTADEYWVGAVYRDDFDEHGFDFVTTQSPPTTTPEWGEDHSLRVDALTDWWALALFNDNGEPELACQVEFDKEKFGHFTGTYFCGDDTEYFSFEIVPDS